MQKIAYFCITIECGGLERLLLQICSELKKNNYDIEPVIVALRKIDDDLYSFFNAANVEVTYLNIDENNFSYKEFIKIYTWLRKNRPDFVHTHAGYKMDPFILLAAKLSGIKKKFCTIHNMDQQKAFKPRLAYKLTSILSNKIVAVSECAKEFYQNNGFYDKKKLNVIYNCPGFQIENITPRTTNLLDKDLIKLINIGSLRIQKGQIYMVRAFEILKCSGYNFSLDIYGADRFGYGDTVRKEIADLELTSVNYRGEVNCVADLLNNADILVAASIREAMPLVVLEALSSGIPIVATDILPHREILGHINSKILVEPCNAYAIAEGVLKLVRQENLYTEFSREAIIRSKDFSLKETVKRHMDLYQS